MSHRAIFILAALGLIAGRYSLAAAAADTVSKEVDAYIGTEMARRHIPGLPLAVIQHQRVEKVSTYG